MEDKSRSLTENSNWDSRRRDDHWRADDGIAESRRWDSRRIQSRTKSSCAAFSRTLWIGRRDQMRGLKTRMSRSKRYYKVVFSILYTFPRACLCPKTGEPNGPRGIITPANIVTSRIATSNIPNCHNSECNIGNCHNPECNIPNCHLSGMEAVMPYISGLMTPDKARPLS